MSQRISETVSVDFVYNDIKKESYPKAVFWRNRLYKVKKVGLHHKFNRGNTLYHVFSVTNGSLFLRLILNTNNLTWKLEEIQDSLFSQKY